MGAMEKDRRNVSFFAGLMYAIMGAYLVSIFWQSAMELDLGRIENRLLFFMIAITTACAATLAFLGAAAVVKSMRGREG